MLGSPIFGNFHIWGLPGNTLGNCFRHLSKFQSDVEESFSKRYHTIAWVRTGPLSVLKSRALSSFEDERPNRPNIPEPQETKVLGAEDNSEFRSRALKHFNTGLQPFKAPCRARTKSQPTCLEAETSNPAPAWEVPNTTRPTTIE